MSESFDEKNMIVVKRVALTHSATLGGLAARNLESQRDGCRMWLHESGMVKLTRGYESFFLNTGIIEHIEIEVPREVEADPLPGAEVVEPPPPEFTPDYHPRHERLRKAEELRKTMELAGKASK